LGFAELVAKTNNPLGRPVGSRNKRTVELWGDLEKRGDLDPAKYLSSIVSDRNRPEELRLQAAGLLMPYKYSKHGAIPEPPPLVWVRQPVHLPHPHVTEIRQVVENIEYLSDLRRGGGLDLASADSLISDQRLHSRRADRGNQAVARARR
jgi:hypothetical protein